MTVAALFVDEAGCYAGLPDVELWGVSRDARTYAGPFACLAHPPCQRWGRFATGAPNKPAQYEVGDDGGCFAAALASVRRWGGVLEHPAYSLAWQAHGLPWPPAGGGWQRDQEGGWCCQVEQGHYGHFSRKPTWMYAVGTDLPALTWGPSPQRIHPRALELHGYAKARRIGVVAMIGGKHKAALRAATPPEFRDVLLAMARSAVRLEVAA